MNVAVVTGASSGIGAGIVKALAGAGIEVHALARRADRLANLAAQTGCIPHEVDVTDGARLADVMAGLAPDILVCNAGRGAGFQGLANTTRETLATTIDINVTALLDTIRLAIPGMTQRGRGHIVTMGSVAGLYPSISSIYGGAKGAVTMIGQSLRLELRGTGIRVTDIRPGRVASEFYDVAVDDPTLRARSKATGIREMMPENIARAVLYAVTAPPHVNVSTIELQPVEQTYGGTQFDPA